LLDQRQVETILRLNQRWHRADTGVLYALAVSYA